MLKTAKNWFLDLIFPSGCVSCGAESSFLCVSCRASLAASPPKCIVCRRLIPAGNTVLPGRTCKPCREKTHIYAFFSPFRYEDSVVSELVYALKYGRVRALGPVLGEHLAGRARFFGFLPSSDAEVVPVPIPSSRKRTRGFNQSLLIAEAFAASLGLSVAPALLSRPWRWKYKPQTGLSRDERIKNAEGSFRVPRPEAVKNKNIVLVDDVLTTGATLQDAARALKEAGAKRIWAVTFAH